MLVLSAAVRSNQLIVAIQFKPFKTTKRVDRCNAVQAFWKHRERPAGYELQNVVLSVLLEKLLER
jgi:hypothetical protein